MLVLHPFRQDPEPQAGGHGHGGPDHRQVQPDHEGAIQLDGVDGQAVEVGERRVAGAKVVDGDLDPLLAQGVEDLDAALHVQHQHGFGQLQRQQARLDIGLPELLRHLPRQGGGELEAGEVDRDRYPHLPLTLPLPHLGQGGGEHPAPDFTNKPHLFGQRDELRRRDMPEHGVVPAQQGLETDQLPLGHVHLRLIAQAQLPPTYGLGQKLLQGQLAVQALLHAGGETLPAQAPHLLGLVHGHVGTSDEVVAIIGVVRIDGDADTAAYGDLGHSAQLQRLAHLGEHEIRHFLRPLARLVERHQGGELVPAEPRQLHVPRADLLEPTGHPLQQAIPRLVAIVVIDQLEVVQVHEHQGEAPPQAAVGLEGLHQAVAIEQAGEGVVPG